MPSGKRWDKRGGRSPERRPAGRLQSRLEPWATHPRGCPSSNGQGRLTRGRTGTRGFDKCALARWGPPSYGWAREGGRATARGVVHGAKRVRPAEPPAGREGGVGGGSLIPHGVREQLGGGWGPGPGTRGPGGRRPPAQGDGSCPARLLRPPACAPSPCAQAHAVPQDTRNRCPRERGGAGRRPGHSRTQLALLGQLTKPSRKPVARPSPARPQALHLGLRGLVAVQMRPR